MADKARFYLEQCIPELKDLEKKKIFTKEEISSVIKKRSEFEHKINSNISRPIDFARYAEYEMNLESLRRKRIKRLGVKCRSYYGQRKILFILDRATRKFHGDLGLWMQYIEYAKKEKAGKVLMRIFASVLKMHPMKPELWIYAARYAMEENADMTEARSYMQKGLRFNKRSEQLWLEYAKLELVYIAKILSRRKILGIDKPEEAEKCEDEEFRDADIEDEDGMIKLPDLTMEDVGVSVRKDPTIATLALEDVKNNPALNGAIPLAVFDAAIERIPRDMAFVGKFFNLFASFTDLACLQSLTNHVAKHARKCFPTSPLALYLSVQSTLVGLDPSNQEFPSALGSALQQVGEFAKNASPLAEFYELFIPELSRLLKKDNLDPAIVKVLKASITKYLKQAEAEGNMTEQLYSNWYRFLRASKKIEEGGKILEKGRKAFPESALLREI